MERSARWPTLRGRSWMPFANARPGRSSVAGAARAFRHLTSPPGNSAASRGAADECDVCCGTSVALWSSCDNLPSVRVIVPGWTQSGGLKLSLPGLVSEFECNREAAAQKIPDSSSPVSWPHCDGRECRLGKLCGSVARHVPGLKIARYASGVKLMCCFDQLLF